MTFQFPIVVLMPVFFFRSEADLPVVIIVDPGVMQGPDQSGVKPISPR